MTEPSRGQAPPLPAEALDAIEAHARDTLALTGLPPESTSQLPTVIRLVEEVRRLRALVKRIHDQARRVPASDHERGWKWCPFCGDAVGAPQGGHAEGCPWPEIEREVGA
jgi:hypothetical protein